MAVIALRTVIIYTLIIIAMRLMGKKQLGELQPSELVSTILISNLASISIESPEIPMLGSILPVLLIVSIEIFLSVLSLKNHKFSRLLSGSPKVVIRGGVVDTQALKELRFTIDDLLEALRGKDIFDLNEVSFALVETNGSISVYKKDCALQITRSDMLFPEKSPATPHIPIIVNGYISYDLLSNCMLSPDWLKKKLVENRIGADDVLLMLCNSDKDYTIIKKDV